ncbi:G patch domain-containing protein 4-like [Limulus polyphemus]|uniref:G patch domain-containing protein 4 n=1 Tax=Limulus polyphemus TaxID=6850 RepID=A0ABM1B1I6_LIMPO|nr:G patch domain-containing protein 4-like [Limulus polyphemus]
MADFAREQLKKFGWTEGKGLGKNENGISTALKPKLKFDTYGVGHNPGEQFSFKWWDHVFNNAARNFDFINSEVGTLNDSTFTPCASCGDESEDEELISRETDEDMFKKCKGRTAHKAARHGYQMNGKLKRIEEQEKAYMTLQNGEETSMGMDQQDNKPYKKRKKNQVSDLKDLRNIKKKQMHSEEDVVNQGKIARKASNSLCNFSDTDVKTRKKQSKRYS